jgi:23S rRNA (uracil1939-C5)-methyltransferase
MRNKKPPKIFSQIKVIDAGAKGKSVGKAPDGRIIFMKEAIPGDIVDVQVKKRRKSYYEGKVISIIKESDFRIDPKCSHFQICGGCSWQNMEYVKQLDYKQKEVQNNLHRIGSIKPNKILPIKKSKKEFFYRNKLEFSFSNSKWLTTKEIQSKDIYSDKDALGFHVPGMWNKVVDIDKCWLQKNPSNRIRNFIKESTKTLGLSFFDYKTTNGDLRSMMIRTSSTGEIMVLIQFYNKPKLMEEFLNSILNEFPNISSLLYVVNKKANDTLYDQKVVCYYGNDHIYEKIDNLKFKINAKSFYQTNSDQTKELYKIVKKFADVKSNEIVYDLYSGIGTISIFISEHAKKVIGIECVNDAVKAAEENKKLNSIKNVAFFCGEIRKVLNNEFLEENGTPDTIIVDPPRSGMHKKVVDKLLAICPKKIVYVSCNSATQARDLELLSKSYKAIYSQAIDMFPQTYHVENVVLLEKIIKNV